MAEQVVTTPTKNKVSDDLRDEGRKRGGGARFFRHEEQGTDGRVRGQYGFVDAAGDLHVVVYVTDQLGHRIRTETHKLEGYGQQLSRLLEEGSSTSDVRDTINKVLKTRGRITQDLGHRNPSLGLRSQSLGLSIAAVGTGVDYLKEQTSIEVSQALEVPHRVYNPTPLPVITTTLDYRRTTRGAQISSNVEPYFDDSDPSPAHIQSSTTLSPKSIDQLESVRGSGQLRDSNRSPIINNIPGAVLSDFQQGGQRSNQKTSRNIEGSNSFGSSGNQGSQGHANSQQRGPVTTSYFNLHFDQVDQQRNLAPSPLVAAPPATIITKPPAIFSDQGGGVFQGGSNTFPPPPTIPTTTGSSFPTLISARPHQGYSSSSSLNTFSSDYGNGTIMNNNNYNNFGFQQSLSSGNYYSNGINSNNGNVQSGQSFFPTFSPSPSHSSSFPSFSAVSSTPTLPLSLTIPLKHSLSDEEYTVLRNYIRRILLNDDTLKDTLLSKLDIDDMATSLIQSSSNQQGPDLSIFVNQNGATGGSGTIDGGNINGQVIDGGIINSELLEELRNGLSREGGTDLNSNNNNNNNQSSGREGVIISQNSVGVTSNLNGNCQDQQSSSQLFSDSAFQNTENHPNFFGSLVKTSALNRPSNTPEAIHYISSPDLSTGKPIVQLQSNAGNKNIVSLDQNNSGSTSQSINNINVIQNDNFQSPSSQATGREADNDSGIESRISEGNTVQSTSSYANFSELATANGSQNPKIIIEGRGIALGPPPFLAPLPPTLLPFPGPVKPPQIQQDISSNVALKPVAVTTVSPDRSPVFINSTVFVTDPGLSHSHPEGITTIRLGTPHHLIGTNVLRFVPAGGHRRDKKTVVINNDRNNDIVAAGRERQGSEGVGAFSLGLSGQLPPPPPLPPQPPPPPFPTSRTIPFPTSIPITTLFSTPIPPHSLPFATSPPPPRFPTSPDFPEPPTPSIFTQIPPSVASARSRPLHSILQNHLKKIPLKSTLGHATTLPPPSSALSPPHHSTFPPPHGTTTSRPHTSTFIPRRTSNTLVSVNTHPFAATQTHITTSPPASTFPSHSSAHGSPHLFSTHSSPHTPSIPVDNVSPILHSGPPLIPARSSRLFPSHIPFNELKFNNFNIHQRVS